MQCTREGAGLTVEQDSSSLGEEERQIVWTQIQGEGELWWRKHMEVPSNSFYFPSEKRNESSSESEKWS